MEESNGQNQHHGLKYRISSRNQKKTWLGLNRWRTRSLSSTHGCKIGYGPKSGTHKFGWTILTTFHGRVLNFDNHQYLQRLQYNTSYNSDFCHLSSPSLFQAPERSFPRPDGSHSCRVCDRSQRLIQGPGCPTHGQTWASKNSPTTLSHSGLVGLSENVVYPYTQWFCWSLSLLNGYLIGGIPYFQTYPGDGNLRAPASKPSVRRTHRSLWTRRTIAARNGLALVLPMEIGWIFRPISGIIGHRWPQMRRT